MSNNHANLLELRQHLREAKDEIRRKVRNDVRVLTSIRLNPSVLFIFFSLHASSKTDRSRSNYLFFAYKRADVKRQSASSKYIGWKKMQPRTFHARRSDIVSKGWQSLYLTSVSEDSFKFQCRVSLPPSSLPPCSDSYLVGD